MNVLNKKVMYIPLLVIALSSFSCKKVNKNPHEYIVDSKLVESINNIKNLYNHDLFYMDYVGDYKLDKLLEQDKGGNVISLLDFANKELLNGKLFDYTINASEFACSAFLAKSSDNHYLYGRNYENKRDLSPFVVKTSPINGYKSLNLIDTSFVGLGKGSIDDGKTDISILVAAPYLVMDGMNEKGLAMSILVVPTPVANQDDESKKTVITTVAVRYILDHCQNIEEAKAALEQFNMRAPYFSLTPPNYHFLISDASGKSVVVEYIKENETSEYCNKINYIEDNAVTNFYLSPSMPVTPDRGQDRYQVIKNTINFKKYGLTKQEALNILSLVGRAGDPNKESCTLWSCLYDLTKKELTLHTRLDFTKTFTFSL